MSLTVALALSAGCAGPASPPAQEGQEVAARQLERGEELLALRRADPAARAFQAALAGDPLLYRAHYGLGRCHYLARDYALEIAEYRKCLAINPGFLPALLDLGHACLIADRLEEARDAYRRVLQLRPGHPAALYNLALVEEDLGDLDAARALLLRLR